MMPAQVAMNFHAPSSDAFKPTSLRQSFPSDFVAKVS